MKKVKVQGATMPSIMFYFEGILDAKNNDDISLKQCQFVSSYLNFASKEYATVLNELHHDYAQTYQLENEVKNLQNALANTSDVASVWRINCSITQKNSAIHETNGKIRAIEDKTLQICEHAQKIVTYKYRAYAKGYGRVNKNTAFKDLIFEDINLANKEENVL